MNENITVPKMVIDALLLVRETGATNMFDRKAVCALAKQFDPVAARWLFNVSNHEFMEALNAMGKILSQEK